MFMRAGKSISMDLGTWLEISRIANEDADGDISETIETLCVEAMEQRGKA